MAALIHSKYKRGGHFVAESMQGQVEASAVLPVLGGRAAADPRGHSPVGHLQAGHRLHRAAGRGHCARASTTPSWRQTPTPSRWSTAKLPRKGRGLGYPKTIVGRIAMAAKGSIKQVLPVKAASQAW